MKIYNLTDTQQKEALISYSENIALEPYQAELVKLQQHIERHKLKLIILFEGRDAAGKGSVIGSVSRYLNPKHYRIVALGRPTEEERTQWYFQRYIKHFPHGGEVVLFDRSWYNRAMVEPVFGFCLSEEHKLFMKHVIPFEESFVEQGTVLVKLYFSVSKEKQAIRFEQRRTDPLRQWKLSEIDLQAQSMWEQFSTTKYRMLEKTNHEKAPWHVIRSSDKHKARLETMKLILNKIEYEGKSRAIDLSPDYKTVFTASQELEIMDMHKLHNM
ncbi:polyphosphate kinase 2 [Candidatus Sulfurimonas marisnigri]|uniref:ADP/GDP-polyphosphate phosphotransferase n=1 Tax=Candidatus Sulfurimonas marisnigri TaxID=2740405 RepID=A0A7S7M234_9BACT|nr:polyphosphate kinase 2 [Candidatus Sulfurimonas marisnigri]QOY55644.1 polyphosphate kinase 2 [Candidatus Sulfurimonas marisnigri]